MNTIRSLLVTLLAASTLFACSSEPTAEEEARDAAEQARLNAEKEGPCGIALWRIEQTLVKCDVETRYFDRRRGGLHGSYNQTEIELIADCYEAASCEALAVYESLGNTGEPVVKTLADCVSNLVRNPDGSYVVREPDGPVCHLTPPPPPDAGDDGELKATDPECRSGRSVCAYREAKQNEYCTDCRAQCATTYGSSCDSSKACKNSCVDVDCDASERERCSDALEAMFD